MNKKKVTSIHKSRSEKKDMPSAVDDAADVMSKYDKINIKKRDGKITLKKLITKSLRIINANLTKK